MKILMISNFNLPTHADSGGLEKMVDTLTKELVQLDQEVLLVATKGSNNPSLAFSPSSPILGDYLNDTETALRFTHVLSETISRFSPKVDIIHSHIAVLPEFFRPFLSIPMITTLHNLTMSTRKPLREKMYDLYPHANYVSISKGQQEMNRALHYVGCIYDGINVDLYRPSSAKKENYLAWAGRVAPKKGLHLAIEVAQKAKVQLRVASDFRDWGHPDYVAKVRAMMKVPYVEYVGHLSEQEMVKFYQRARAVLLPTLEVEPFGLITVEAMACGTPAIAFDIPALNEVIIPNKTGFLVKLGDTDAMAAKVKEVDSLDLQLCREVVVERFSSKRMARDYLKLYQQLAKR